MPSFATVSRTQPYGRAFAVEDLVLARQWALRRACHFSIRLDQVLDGAEFEELLLLKGPGHSRRAATVWRTDNAVIAQEAGGQPHSFSGLAAALAHVGARLDTPRQGGWWLGKRKMFFFEKKNQKTFANWLHGLAVKLVPGTGPK